MPLKPLFHTTPPKKVAKTSQLPSLYKQQRTLTAAKHAVADEMVKKALQHKHSLMSRRIAQLQTEEKLDR